MRSEQTVALLILSGLLFQRNFKYSVFDSETNFSGIGKIRKIGINLESIKLFYTVIFPRGMNFLLCHTFRLLLAFSKILNKVISSIRFKFTLKAIPRSTNFTLPQSRFTEALILSLEYFFFRIHITFVFSLFILRPEKFPYISSVLSADLF